MISDTVTDVFVTLRVTFNIDNFAAGVAVCVAALCCVQSFSHSCSRRAADVSLSLRLLFYFLYLSSFLILICRSCSLSLVCLPLPLPGSLLCARSFSVFILLVRRFTRRHPRSPPSPHIGTSVWMSFLLSAVVLQLSS